MRTSKFLRHIRYSVTGSGLVASTLPAGQGGRARGSGLRKAETVKSQEFRDLVKDLTLHIAAAHPLVVSRDQVDTLDAGQGA